MTLPQEVIDRVAARFGTFDHARVVFFAKTVRSQCHAWELALETKIGGQGADGPWGNGWRKCHTENYWVYYAKFNQAGVEEKQAQYLEQKRYYELLDDESYDQSDDWAHVLGCDY